jgi:hypothetical protein
MICLESSPADHVMSQESGGQLQEMIVKDMPNPFGGGGLNPMLTSSMSSQQDQGLDSHQIDLSVQNPQPGMMSPSSQAIPLQSRNTIRGPVVVRSPHVIYIPAQVAYGPGQVNQVSESLDKEGLMRSIFGGETVETKADGSRKVSKGMIASVAGMGIQNFF